MVATDLARALEGLGVDVVGPAGSIEDALALVAAHGRIDGAVVDINLRGQRAYPVADALVREACRSFSQPATTRGSIPTFTLTRRGWRSQ